MVWPACGIYAAMQQESCFGWGNVGYGGVIFEGLSAYDGVHEMDFEAKDCAGKWYKLRSV
jgi:hypothetical protein